MTYKNLLTNLGLAIASIMLFFLAGEVGLRITGLQTVKPNPPKIYQVSDDPRISYELIPNLNNEKAYREHVSTNEYGFRLNGEPGTKNQEPGTIAILGDSITFGYGVQDNETLPARIDARIDDYQVLNAAVPGYQLVQETATYETKVAALNPEALILVFYFNDLTSETAWLDDIGVIRAEGWVQGEMECSPIERGILKYLPGKCWLDNHSAFYKAFKKLVNIRNMNQELEKSRKLSQENPEEDDVTENQLYVYAQQLDVLVALLKKDMPRLFVIWPDRNVHEPSRPKIKALAEQRGFVVLDLYDTFGNEAETISWDSVHPSPQTIEQASEVIVEILHSLLQ